MVMKAVARFGLPRRRQLGYVHRGRLLAQDAGPGQGPNRYGLRSGAEPADIADQHEAREAGVRVIGPDRLDIVARPAEFRFADALAIDKDLHRFDLHETDDPTLDAQRPVSVDGDLVEVQLHRRPVEDGGFGGGLGERIDRRDLHLLRRDIDAQRPPADLAVDRAHRQQRLDRAAGGTRQVEGQQEAGIPGVIAARIKPADIRTGEAVGRLADDGPSIAAEISVIAAAASAQPLIDSRDPPSAVPRHRATRPRPG